MDQPSPLQDFCVADLDGPITMNGFACKNPANVDANDFFFSGLRFPGNTSNPVGSKVTPAFVTQLPGLNGLGISMVRVDYAPWGLNPPHVHPRATEVLTVIKGTLEVGFVTSNPENRLITRIINKGDVFVFPIGLVHFQRNIGRGHAKAVSGLSSPNPGIVRIAESVFGSNPEISPDILAKAFQSNRNVMKYLQSKF
ncbi:Putative germin-like protein 2-1 [Linum grandiflorum]